MGCSLPGLTQYTKLRISISRLLIPRIVVRARSSNSHLFQFYVVDIVFLPEYFSVFFDSSLSDQEIILTLYLSFSFSFFSYDFIIPIISLIAIVIIITVISITISITL